MMLQLESLILLGLPQLLHNAFHFFDEELKDTASIEIAKESQETLEDLSCLIFRQKMESKRKDIFIK